MAPCCTTKPPSPTAFEPDANLINLSAISKSVVFWNEAVPWTVKFLLIIASLVTVKSWPIVTSLGSPTVTVCADTLVSISLLVPAISKVCDANATVDVPPDRDWETIGQDLTVTRDAIINRN